MFDKEYSFIGKHAEMVIKLTNEFDNKKNKFFEHNYDVYMLAPIIGFLYQRKAELDRNSNIKSTKIFPEQLIRRADEFKFTYRLIMLLDKSHEPELEARIEKAFRGLNNSADEELYESYVRGGVEVLYEKLIEGATQPTEYTEKLYDFLEEFDERYNQEIDMESVLEMCRKVKS